MSPSLFARRELALAAVATALFCALGASAAETPDTSVTRERTASDVEKMRVSESISRIGCKATLVEKESAVLFEVDDAVCEIGTYDIKLDGNYAIISLTRD